MEILRLTCASEDEVRRFLSTRTFSGYQRVPLPHDLAVPGIDRRAVADAVFSRGVAGKRVLDIGTYHGYFAIEALHRGAHGVVAVEPDPVRAAIAQEIARLYGDSYRVLQARAEELLLDTDFDLVLLLNVLHHVQDPVEVLRRVARMSSELIVVEFATVAERKFLTSAFSPAPRLVRAFKVRLALFALKRLTPHVPLAAVGDCAGKRGFFFSEIAFRNLVIEHLQLFRGVDFQPSPRRPSRVLAFCHI